MARIFDCIVIGGGIGGLAAGVYLSRFNLHVMIIDDNKSRASLIPVSYNFPAFPEGISGKDILERMTAQYNRYGNKLIKDKVISVNQLSENRFKVRTENKAYLSKTIILATGVFDIEPSCPNLVNAIKNGVVRHCLICDGYEQKNKRIAILGDNLEAVNHALLLHTYSSDLTIIMINKKFVLSSSNLERLRCHKIRFIYSRISDMKVTGKKIQIFLDQDSQNFDTVYSALGIKPQFEKGINLGIRYNKDKLIMVNSRQETNVKGVFAVGDIVPGLNQMTVACTHAAIAATRIFNILADRNLNLRKKGKQRN